MKKRITEYLIRIDKLLTNPPQDADWEDEIQKHLIQIGFFMHERLVHLIVTMVFAILTVLSILYAINNATIGMLLLIVAFMVLLIPYIMHYYLLENGVQRMYKQYDEMLYRKENQ
ncbi:MAG: hypothetical protein IJZ25_02440 [Lachnospiraceae bacterium]|nr:hypothetical protein [Lachnospiraceae bacterium]